MIRFVIALSLSASFAFAQNHVELDCEGELLNGTHAHVLIERDLVSKQQYLVIEQDHVRSYAFAVTNAKSTGGDRSLIAWDQAKRRRSYAVLHLLSGSPGSLQVIDASGCAQENITTLNCQEVQGCNPF